MMPIPYARQTIGGEDVHALVEAVCAPMITQGPMAERFEAKFAEAVGARYAVAFSSGTAALHAAYAAAGVGPGQGVVTTPITFAATANAARFLDADVTFADIDPVTAQIDPIAVAVAPTKRVRVVAPVHFGGHVADMPAIFRTASARGWLVVEDAAHALGATYRTRDGGTYQVGACAHSAMCCFSLHAVKHITTGEGGMVTTNDEDFVRALRLFRTHGITRERSQMAHDEGPWYYEQLELGYNYRLTEFQSALGLSQLTRLGEFVDRRREVAARYDEAFAFSGHASPLASPEWSDGSYHLYVIRVPASERRVIYDRLQAAGILVNVHYVPVYRHPYYQRLGFAGLHLTHAESYYASALSLPMYPGLTDADVARVIDAVHRQFARVRAVA